MNNKEEKEKSSQLYEVTIIKIGKVNPTPIKIFLTKPEFDEVYKREDGLYFSYKLGLKYNDKKNVNDF